MSSQSTSVLDDAREMALLASVEAGTPEDCADAAVRVVLDHLIEESAVLVIPAVATAYMRKLLEELTR